MKGKADISGFLIWFAVGILIGCLYLNCLWRFGPFLNISERNLAMTLWCEDQTYHTFWKMGLGILGAVIYLFTLCSGFTYLGKVLSKGFCLILGIWWGAFFTECILVKGISMLFVVLKNMFPESLLFVVSYVTCLIWVNNMSTIWGIRGRRTGKNGGKYWRILLISIFLFAIWAICSFYVNIKK